MALPPNSKTEYTMHYMKIVSIRYKNPFTWKYFATSHGKRIVDGIGRRPKSLTWQKVTRKSKGWLIVQNAEEFAIAAKALMEKLKVIFVEQIEIEECKDKITFSEDCQCHKECHKFILPTMILQHLYFMKGNMLLIVHITRTLWCSHAVGDRVLVTYNGYGQCYPGEITSALKQFTNKSCGKGWCRFQMAKKGRQNILWHGICLQVIEPPYC